MKVIYNNPLWIADIDVVSENIRFELDQLAEKKILITGAAGLICSALIDVLFRYNDTHSSKINILAAGRSYNKIQKRFGKMTTRSDFVYIPYDSTRSLFCIDEHADYIIHGGTNAYPEIITKEPVETMFGNFFGLKVLLDYAKDQKTKRLLYISSSEVYGRKQDEDPYREDDYGYVDLLNVRSSYAVGKRAAETLCVSYIAEYGLNCVIVRPGHIYGPTASDRDNRVSSLWAYAASKGENIVMKSDGSQLRSYVYCLDCAAAILTALIRGDNGKAYNVSNISSVINVRQLAETLAKNGNIMVLHDVPTEAEKNAYNPMTNSSLEGSSLVSLGMKYCFNAETGLNHTVQILRML